MGVIGWIKSWVVNPDAKPADSKPRSPHWPKVRKAWLADHPTCRACGETDHLEVHHKKPFHLHPDLELDPSNFITLCERPSRNCHLTWGHFYNWSKFNPNVEADTTGWLKQVTAKYP